MLHVQCPGIVECVLTLQLKEYCQQALSCPACTQPGNCPSAVDLVLERLNTRHWDLALYDPEGNLVPYTQRQAGTATVMRIQTSPSDFDNERLGNYTLALANRSGSATTPQDVRLGIEAVPEAEATASRNQ